MRCTLMNIAVFLAMTLFMASCFAEGAPVQPAAKSATQTTGSATYTVPQNGTPAQYMAFIEKLLKVERPQNQTKKETVAHFTNLCKAQIAAADKVIQHKDATSEQIRRAASVKIKSLQILIKLGSKKAKALLDAMPAELKKANQSKMADDISMGLINLKFKEAKKTNDFSEIEKIIAQTTEAIKKTPADNKDKLQSLYRIKLLCIKELGTLKGADNSAAFDAVVAEVKSAGLTDMVEDVVLSKLINALADSTAQNDKALFDRTAKSVDATIANYGAKANSKVAAVAFRTAYAEEVFDAVAAAARYTKYANYFVKFKDAKIQDIVKKMQGAAKRLALKGKPLPITGKTVDEAVDTGLSELCLKREQVEILVIDQGSKGFLGFGVKPARVQLIVNSEKEKQPAEEKAAAAPAEEVKPEKTKAPTPAPTKEKQEKPASAEKREKPEKPAKKFEKREQPKKTEHKPVTPVIEAMPEEEYVKPENPSEDAVKAEKFLIGLLEILKIDGKVELLSETSEKVVYNVITEDSSSVIGYRGEVLDSLQTLVSAVYNTDKEKYLRVVVDCESYRSKREKTLVSLARKLAQKAVATGRKVTLEPMNPYERRIIHSALIDFEGVKTVSEGKEPNRFVAIIPDGYDPSKQRRGGKFGGKGKGGKPMGRGGHDSPKSAPKAKSTFGAGVFLGNSLKDNKNE